MTTRTPEAKLAECLACLRWLLPREADPVSRNAIASALAIAGITNPYAEEATP